MIETISAKYLYPLGRFLLGLYFLLPGLAKVFFFQENLDVVITREVPLPGISLSIVAVAQIFFGTMLMVGKFVHIGSIVLALITVLINLYIHDFWNMADNPDQAHETQNFVKNLGILAGLLVLSATKLNKLDT
jgi:putative oxidoreductase|tara:strand:- start:435 stop:833 length:399 start_codon:yes stop_codon:yes gene_type:complete